MKDSGKGAAVLEQTANTSQHPVYLNQDARTDKPTKLTQGPLEHIAEVERQIKLRKRIPQTYILPGVVEFCELLLENNSICNEERYRDKNCFEEKAEGCKIYQRYTKIKKVFKNENITLGLLKISNYILPIHKG